MVPDPDVRAQQTSEAAAYSGTNATRAVDLLLGILGALTEIEPRPGMMSFLVSLPDAQRELLELRGEARTPPGKFSEP
jgi:hypothetical protein